MSGDRAFWTRAAATASITVAVVLVGAKLWATLASGSTAMLGSLADSGLDLVASLVTLLGVWFASQPADREHRFGHGKAEALAAMVQVVLIAVSASAIAVRSIQRLVDPQPVTAVTEGIAVSGFAILATIALLAFQRYVIVRTGSVAIRADHVHYQADVLLNVAVIAALALSRYAGLPLADPLFGLAIAVWLMWGAWGAAIEAVDQLLDREWPDDKRAAFVAAAAEHPELSNLHDLRTRTSGTRDFAQFHVDLPGTMSVAEAHAIIDRVEADLAARFPGTELLVHIDPEGHVDEPDNPLVETDEFAEMEKDL